jgi:mRNA-degrading endonuclease RelE of RelBE toxin-antitoxin system
MRLKNKSLSNKLFIDSSSSLNYYFAPGVTLKMTPAFERNAKDLLTPESLDSLLDHLEFNPEKGAIIKGTGGVRKMRWGTGKNNKGKSGGIRVLYHYSKGILILLIALYSKSKQHNINQHQRNALKQSLPQLIAKYREAN